MDTITLFDASRYHAVRFVAGVRELVAASGGAVTSRMDGDRMVLTLDAPPELARELGDLVLDGWLAWRSTRAR
jgi:hypothetical protein